jgi:4,5:9,10-diseco-3-hydroxy-5,9,17-trioxoandrosta-1(10),2-diene-4-oate hydrolase
MAIGVLVATGIVGVAHKERDTQFRLAVGAQRPHKVAVLDGVSIAYSDSGGDGPALICLPAIGHGARDFEGLSQRLASQYRVLALDWPAQGDSGPDPLPASATRYANLLSEFIDQLNLKTVALIGNSIGGAASIRYSSTHPERVRGLVLCDSGGLGEPTFKSRVFIAGFVQFFAAGRRGAFWYPRAFGNYYKHVLITASARKERDRIVRSAYEIASPSEQAWTSFGRPEENLLRLLPKIQCPVLLAWAKQDLVIPLKSSERYFELIKDHQLEVFEGGHAAFLEDPDHFERSVRAFLLHVESGAACASAIAVTSSPQRTPV